MPLKLLWPTYSLEFSGSGVRVQYKTLQLLTPFRLPVLGFSRLREYCEGCKRCVTSLPENLGDYAGRNALNGMIGSVIYARFFSRVSLHKASSPPTQKSFFKRTRFSPMLLFSNGPGSSPSYCFQTDPVLPHLTLRHSHIAPRVQFTILFWRHPNTPK